MPKLIPDWCKHFDEFWDSIRKRNLMFIRLRYFAAFSLALFAMLSRTLFGLSLSSVQTNVIFSVTLFLFVYNLIVHKLHFELTRNAKKFNPVHLSVLQMVADLILLTVIIYYTGGIESPFLSFYIFHMIIGSLVLPSCMVYLSAFLVSAIITALAFLELSGSIVHHCVYGLLNSELYLRPTYVSITLITFYATLFFSVYIANKIARQLYVQEEHLINALDELKNSNERKQKYIMGVMHEIKSPIAASQSLVELLIGGYAGEISEKAKDKLVRIRKRNVEAIEMINDILRISRIHMLSESELEEVNPVDLLEKETEKVKDFAKQKEIEITIAKPKGKKRTVKGDARVISLALSNILSNAIKYTQRGGKIEALAIFKQKYLEIRICDNGKGIPKDEIEKVFTPFYRLKRDKGKIEGSGLGLALVKEIVNQHNGEILLESPSHLGDAEHPGTCCLLRLPYSPDKQINDEINS